MKVGRRETVEFGIHGRHALSHPGSEDPSQEHPKADDGSDQLEVVEPDLTIVIAESLEGGDLLALERKKATQGDVEKEGGDGQENRRGNQAHGLELLQFVRDEAVREMQIAVSGPQTAIGLEFEIKPANHFVPIGSGHQGNREVVESAFHVEGCFHLLARHPEDSESAIVGKQTPGLNGGDVFR